MGQAPPIPHQGHTHTYSLLSTGEQNWAHPNGLRAFPCSPQSGEVRRGVLDQLYVSEAETTLSAGPMETRDGPSTASRLVQDPRGLG